MGKVGKGVGEEGERERLGGQKGTEGERSGMERSWAEERRTRRRKLNTRSPPPSPGYRAPVTLVKKGCWTGPTAGAMQSNQDALPPDYSVVRGCAEDFCNNHLATHDVIPNLSQGGKEGGAGRLEAG